MQCYYELLGIPLTATERELKTAYRAKALALHPDKNPNGQEEFIKVQEAYEVLTDPNERAWYDRNRNEILRGKSNVVVSEFVTKQYLMGFFATSSYNGINDNDGGFYKVYAELFIKLETDEREAYENDPECLANLFNEECCQFGDSSSSFEPKVKQFYGKFTSFSTCKSFSWADEYKLFEIDDRRVRRMAEQKNKKARDSARKEYNAAVCNLASLIKKRDPRVKAHQEFLKTKAEQVQAKLLAKQKQDREERARMSENYTEPEWSKVDEPDFGGIDDDSGICN